MAGGATRLGLLGGFELWVDGRTVALPPGVERLLALLALQTRPHARLHFASRLWPDRDEERSIANLRSALWRLRRAVDPLVDAENGRLRLGESVEVDVNRVVHQADRLVSTGPCENGDLDPSPLFDDLLPDWYDDWVLMEQERLRQLRLHALEALAARLSAMGRFAEAVDAALAAIRIEPLRESGHRALIAVHLAEGNRGEAFLQYQRMARLLRAEIGIDPTFTLRHLEVGDAVTTGR